MDNRLEQLEYTVMELGTEIFRLKAELNDMTDKHSQLNGVVSNIRTILDEKGVLEAEDLDISASLREFDAECEENNLDVDKPVDGTKTEYH